jgi:hypothetical protein
MNTCRGNFSDQGIAMTQPLFLSLIVKSNHLFLSFYFSHVKEDATMSQDMNRCGAVSAPGGIWHRWISFKKTISWKLITKFYPEFQSLYPLHDPQGIDSNSHCPFQTVPAAKRSSCLLDNLV